jgi:hypothetical protein
VAVFSRFAPAIIISCRIASSFMLTSATLFDCFCFLLLPPPALVPARAKTIIDRFFPGPTQTTNPRPTLSRVNLSRNNAKKVDLSWVSSSRRAGAGCCHITSWRCRSFGGPPPPVHTYLHRRDTYTSSATGDYRFFFVEPVKGKKVEGII